MGFVMIFCFQHFKSNRCFVSFLGKSNAITVDKFRTRKTSFLLRLLTAIETHLSRVIYIQKYSPWGFPKDSFSEKFFKYYRKVDGEGGYRPKTRLLHGCFNEIFSLPFLCFLNSYIKNFLEVFTSPVPPHSN